MQFSNLNDIRNNIFIEEVSSLNPNYRFDNYICGNTNRIAFSAAQYVGEHLGLGYNPLLIYGSSGLGKTHLMHAIGNAIFQQRPNLKVISITSEHFINLFIESVKKGQGDIFRNTFYNIDVLMIDDIRFLDNKEDTEIEFLNIFDELYKKGKQIVLTSDIMPDDMERFGELLRPRLQDGFVATLERPDLEMRIAILKFWVECEKQRKNIITIDNDVLCYIALQFDEEIRTLKGVFNRLILSATIDERKEVIDLQYTKEILDSFIYMS